MELKQLMREFGLVGAGGAGFPSYGKLNGGADTLLINGAECEPLLYTDYTLLKNELSYVISGTSAVAEELGIKKVLLCIKEHTAQRLAFDDGAQLCENIFVKVLPNVYPIGDEISLVYQATGRLIQPSSLPISAGVIVYNVETMYNMGIALRQGKPVTHKWLTIGGDIDRHVIVRVPIGTRISELFKRLGVTVKEGYSVIDGGPSMGKLINYRNASVSKTTKALLVLPDNIRAVESKKINEKAAIARAETACCQCTRCTDMCPRHLLGYPLEPHKMVRTAMGAVTVMPILVSSATLCCGCGICENLACSQGISPKAVINGYKALLAQNKMKYQPKGKVSAKEERDYRMIPSEKWAQDLGVARFDKIPEEVLELEDFDTLEVPLNRHIGAPSTPFAHEGEIAESDAMIATAADGLSVPQHSPMPGKIRITKDKIIIDKV